MAALGEASAAAGRGTLNRRAHLVQQVAVLAAGRGQLQLRLRLGRRVQALRAA